LLACSFHFWQYLQISGIILSCTSWCQILTFLTRCLLATPTPGLANLICAPSLRGSSTLPRTQHSLQCSSDNLLTALSRLSNISFLVCFSKMSYLRSVWFNTIYAIK
jgi:hypothetical protein